MRRSIDEAFADLRAHVQEWVASGARPGIRLFVYPPEWEAQMLTRFRQLPREYVAVCALEVVDVGQGFLAALERRKGFVDQLNALEVERPDDPLHDLGVVAKHYLKRVLASAPDPPAAARLLVNTGTLGTVVSYSGLTNALHDVGVEGGVALPTVLAFPGEGDDRVLNLMGLRTDTNYRVPRI